MELNLSSLQNREAWADKGVELPQFDVAAMREKTLAAPSWLHFGAGNIFRGFIARLAQDLLDQGLTDKGIIAVESYDEEIIEKIYKPYDNLTLLLGLRADGEIDKKIIASLADGMVASQDYPEDLNRLKDYFANDALQMVSFTITEKGYALTNMQGELYPVVVEDIEKGPEAAKHVMSIVAALLWHRFQNGATPIAVVSMDNCSHNGEKLRGSVTRVAEGWAEKGHVSKEFIDWLEDEAKVSFPWSMIDKITPRPAPVAEEHLTELGIENMAPVQTTKHTFIAPFVNAELAEYLVVEDRFPNGRPPLEKAGVYMTDRDTVNDMETMKVTTCLNPLHTALAVYGCLLGHESIADEMQDPELKALVERVGEEGMPVVVHPGIVEPRDFLEEVLEERFPNPYMPDTPQRIATDTSQKIPVRFGETMKSYVKADKDLSGLVAIPLAIAGWLRYLLGVDDQGNDMPLSPDPMLETMQEQLKGIEPFDGKDHTAVLQPILKNENVFGLDLVAAGLADKIIDLFHELNADKGAVRATLAAKLK